MKIKIPHRVTAIAEVVLDWLNIPLWSRGRFEFRRIDLLVIVAGILCVSYYGYVSGWRGAIVGGSMFVLFAMMALWLL